jgi:aromatic ring-opening dioxygenase catalytic subunit (LigB family)
MTNSKLPTYFLSHGGGPWPWLKEEMPFYDELERSLQAIPRQIGVLPKAILVISGHWENSEFSVMASAHPPMLYDYSGFPEKTYQIKYPAPGAPELAAKVQKLIQGAGFSAHLDKERGFDHGTFAPLYAMYPQANVPVIQLSLRSDYDPEAHFKVGRALAPLREEGVLIVGSGLSFHNMRAIRQPGAAGPASRQFDEWLQKTLVHSTPEQRSKNLLHWAQAPAARVAHPQEDHLIPLMVVVGAAENETGQMDYHEENFMGGITTSSFSFGQTVKS